MKEKYLILRQKFYFMNTILNSLGDIPKGCLKACGYNIHSNKKPISMNYKKRILPVILAISILLPYWPLALSSFGSTCGDKKIDSGEQCEPPNTSRCDSSCKIKACDCDTLSTDSTDEFCGDGIVQSNSEQCDDGNNIDYDSCNNVCRTGSNLSDLTTEVNYSIYSVSTQNRVFSKNRSANIRFDVLPPAPAVIAKCGVSAPACNGTCDDALSTCATVNGVCQCIPLVKCNKAKLATNCVEGNDCPLTADNRIQYCAPKNGACLCQASVQQIGGNVLNNCMVNANPVGVELFTTNGESFRDFANSIATILSNTSNSTTKNQIKAFETSVNNTVGNTSTFLDTLATNLNNSATINAANTQVNTLRNLFNSTPVTGVRFRSIVFTNADGKDFTGLDLHSSNKFDFIIGGVNFANVNWACINLTNANLGGVDFREQNSVGPILTGATLVNTNFSSAVLKKANLSPDNNAGFPSADISQTNFSDAKLQESIFTTVRFTTNPTSFMGANINNLQIDRATFDKLPGATIGGNTIMGATGKANVQ